LATILGQRQHSDFEWLVVLAATSALQFGCWLALWSTGIAGAPLIGEYDGIAIIGLGLALVPFFFWHLYSLYRTGESHPAKRMLNSLDRSRVAAVAIATIIDPITAGAFSSLKAAIPLVIPFYLDRPITRFEASLFGTDAWRITHALLGWATPVIDRFYLSWLPIMLLAFNFVLLSKPSALKTRSLIAYLLMWPVIGTFGAYLLSSAGPIFHDATLGGHSGLLDALSREGAPGTLFAYHHLWNGYAHRFSTLGGGISAMPSMHISMAFWLALTIRGAFPRYQWAGWTYAALIWLGSVHLGWHYFSDGLVGGAAALMIWRVAGSRIWIGRRSDELVAPMRIDLTAKWTHL
jgi:hypothetical protein